MTVSEDDFDAADGGSLSDLYDEDVPNAARAVQNGKHYIPLPDTFEIDEYRMMERFAESIPDRKSSNLLLVALRGSGAFRRFKDTLGILDLLEHWYKYRDEAYEEVAIAWCEENNIEYVRP